MYYVTRECPHTSSKPMTCSNTHSMRNKRAILLNNVFYFRLNRGFSTFFTRSHAASVPSGQATKTKITADERKTTAGVVVNRRSASSTRSYGDGPISRKSHSLSLLSYLTVCDPSTPSRRTAVRVYSKVRKCTRVST